MSAHPWPPNIVGMAKLRNRTKRMQVFNLPHANYCVDGECYCSDTKRKQMVHDAATGVKGLAESDFKVSASVTFLAGETQELPDSALDCPEVAAAIQARDLVEVD